MLKSCLFLIGLPLLAALGLFFFVGILQMDEAAPVPGVIPPAIEAPSLDYVPPMPPTQSEIYQTATAIILFATETAQVTWGTPTATPTFGSPTALPTFEATSTPFPNPT